MSAISNFLSFLRSAIYAIDVRDGIADAIEQCYNDVNNPTLKTEALEAALQTKIDEGEMAALTIGDGTITGAKLANGTIPKAKLDPSITFDADDELDNTSTNAIQNKVVAAEFLAINESLGSLTEPQRLADGTDLDTVLTPGVYMLHTDNSYLHKPTADSEHGILEVWHEVFGNNVGRTFQRLTYTYKAGRTSIEVWVRTYSAFTSTWNAWVSTTGDLSRKSMLLSDDVPNTTQSYTFTDGKVSQVTHSRNSVAIRTDVFTYGTGTITEVLTLSTGESLTIVTDLTTLETTVTYNGGV